MNTEHSPYPLRGKPHRRMSAWQSRQMDGFSLAALHCTLSVCGAALAYANSMGKRYTSYTRMCTVWRMIYGIFCMHFCAAYSRCVCLDNATRARCTLVVLMMTSFYLTVPHIRLLMKKNTDMKRNQQPRQMCLNSSPLVARAFRRFMCVVKESIQICNDSDGNRRRQPHPHITLELHTEVDAQAKTNNPTNALYRLLLYLHINFSRHAEHNNCA